MSIKSLLVACAPTLATMAVDKAIDVTERLNGIDFTKIPDERKPILKGVGSILTIVSIVASVASKKISKDVGSIIDDNVE